MWKVRGPGDGRSGPLVGGVAITVPGYGRPGCRVDRRPGGSGTSLRLRVRGLDHRVDPTPDQPVRGHRHPARGDGRHQVVEDAVGHVLVEAALVAVAPQVQLERLELY